MTRLLREIETETPEEKAFWDEREQETREFEESQMKRLKVSEWRVLLTLAYNSPRNRYQISEDLGCKYPPVHRATKSLERIRWVEVVEERRSEKNVPTKVYGLTREGLLWLLSKIPVWVQPSLVFAEEDSLGLRRTLAEKDISKVKNLKTQNDIYLHLLLDFDVNRIAKNNTHLFPLIFENWTYYREIKVAQDLVSIMPETAFSTLVEYYNKWGDFLEACKHKFDMLDLFFPYKLYYAYLEMLTGTSQISVYEKEFQQKATKVFRSKQQLKNLFEIFSSKIKKKTAERLQFMENLRSAMLDYQ